MNVFVDTNVLLDVLAQREPFHAPALRIWILTEQRKVSGFVSAISFNNVYYAVRRLESASAGYRAVRILRDTFVPVPLDEEVLNQAIDADFPDFEDAIQFFSALKADAACIITRNPEHFPPDEMAIQTPLEFLAMHFPA